MKNKLFSMINVFGLAIGLSASFVIGVIIFYDFTFDKFHPDGDRIYRITTEFSSPEGTFYNPGVAVPLGVDLKENGLIGLEKVAPVFTTYPLHVKKENPDKTYKAPEFVVYADGGYFQTFKYEWLAGATDNVLSNPNELVLTENRAKKYFPGEAIENIVGSTLVYNDTIPVTITGIVANFKERTDLVFEEFISLKTANQSDMTSAVRDGNWNSTNSASQLFVKLAENANVVNVQQAFNKLATNHADEETTAMGQKRNFYMQPLRDLHFDPNYNIFDFNGSRASISVLTSLGIVALFLLLLGCINFINLNTAQATKRSKEIGIRKTLGSSKKQLIFQFLGETWILTVVAAIVSLFITGWLLQVFSDFIPEGIGFELLWRPVIIIAIVFLLVLVTLLSGFYPALVLSKFKPVSVLKSQIINGQNKADIRKYLTVFQFAIAQIFIIATLLVGKQLNFVMKKDMGFKTEAIAFFRTPWHDAAMEKRVRFFNEIKALPQISDVSLGGDPPASLSTHSTDIKYLDGEKEVFLSLQFIYGDKNYFDLYKLNLLAGRLALNDTIKEYVINRTLLNKLGFENPEDAIGKTLNVSDELIPIVGVMDDFHQRSLKSDIKPMAMVGDLYRERYSQFNTIHLKLQTQEVGDWPDTVAKVENIWNEIYPNAEFGLSFMDDMVQRFYVQESKMSLLLNWATGLSIIISCLGLLALVIHTTERRIKEIGVRKVLGASLSQLNLLLCKEFLGLVGVAFVIAIPIAWYGLDYWLQDFAYKTNLSWWVFLLSGLAMLIIAMLIMSIRTIAAANANPVKSLRTE